MLKSFANKISIYVILLTALLFIVTALTVYRLSYSLVQKEAVTNAYSQIKALKLEMENVLDPVSVTMENSAPIAEKLAMNNSDTTEFLSLISSILTNTPHLTDIAVSLEPYLYRDMPRFTAYAIRTEDSVGKAVPVLLLHSSERQGRPFHRSFMRQLGDRLDYPHDRQHQAL